MRKPEENNKFRKKENAKKQYGSKSERPEKHICPPGECDLAKKCGGCQYQEWIMKSSSTRNIGK